MAKQKKDEEATPEATSAEPEGTAPEPEATAAEEEATAAEEVSAEGAAQAEGEAAADETARPTDAAEGEAAADETPPTETAESEVTEAEPAASETVETEVAEAEPDGAETVETEGTEAAEPEVAAAGETREEPIAESEPARTLVELAADARYSATGKRKSAVARVILLPGSGGFLLNGKPLDSYFPRRTLQEVVRQPLKVTGYLDRVDIRARIHGGGISSQADAVRHGIAKALIEADPNLRGDLKRKQLLTRDPRVKERRKAGLKKARKRPQFSKR
jgi:small subunit ribosomal protein S9